MTAKTDYFRFRGYIFCCILLQEQNNSLIFNRMSV